MSPDKIRNDEKKLQKFSQPTEVVVRKSTIIIKEKKSLRKTL